MCVCMYVPLIIFTEVLLLRLLMFLLLLVLSLDDAALSRFLALFNFFVFYLFVVVNVVQRQAHKRTSYTRTGLVFGAGRLYIQISQ